MLKRILPALLLFALLPAAAQAQQCLSSVTGTVNGVPCYPLDGRFFHSGPGKGVEQGAIIGGVVTNAVVSADILTLTVLNAAGLTETVTHTLEGNPVDSAAFDPTTKTLTLTLRDGRTVPVAFGALQTMTEVRNSINTALGPYATDADVADSFTGASAASTHFTLTRRSGTNPVEINFPPAPLDNVVTGGNLTGDTLTLNRTTGGSIRVSGFGSSIPDERLLPEVTTANNGSIVKVTNGVWALGIDQTGSGGGGLTEDQVNQLIAPYARATPSGTIGLPQLPAENALDEEAIVEVDDAVFNAGPTEIDYDGRRMIRHDGRIFVADVNPGAIGRSVSFRAYTDATGHFRGIVANQPSSISLDDYWFNLSQGVWYIRQSTNTVRLHTVNGNFIDGYYPTRAEAEAAVTGSDNVIVYPNAQGQNRAHQVTGFVAGTTTHVWKPIENPIHATEPISIDPFDGSIGIQDGAIAEAKLDAGVRARLVDLENIETNVVRATGNTSGSIGTSSRRWSAGHFDTLAVAGAVVSSGISIFGGIQVSGELDANNDIHLGDRDQLILGTGRDATFDYDDRTSEVEIVLQPTADAFVIHDGSTERFVFNRDGTTSLITDADINVTTPANESTTVAASRQSVAEAIAANAGSGGGSELFYTITDANVGGTGDAITLATGESLSAVQDGSVFVFESKAANTGAVTVSVDGNTALSVQRSNGNGGSTALTGGEFTSSDPIILVYQSSFGGILHWIPGHMGLLARLNEIGTDELTAALRDEIAQGGRPIAGLRYVISEAATTPDAPSARWNGNIYQAHRDMTIRGFSYYRGAVNELGIPYAGACFDVSRSGATDYRTSTVNLWNIRLNDTGTWHTNQVSIPDNQFGELELRAPGDGFHVDRDDYFACMAFFRLASGQTAISTGIVGSSSHVEQDHADHSFNENIMSYVARASNNRADRFFSSTNIYNNSTHSIRQQILYDALPTQFRDGVVDAASCSGNDLVLERSEGLPNITAQNACAGGGGGGSGEANVQADWDESDTASDAFIRNKPTTITAVQTAKLASIENGAEVNERSDWNETTQGDDAFILNKPPIPTSATLAATSGGDVTLTLGQSGGGSNITATLDIDGSPPSEHPRVAWDPVNNRFRWDRERLLLLGMQGQVPFQVNQINLGFAADNALNIIGGTITTDPGNLRGTITLPDPIDDLDNLASNSIQDTDELRLYDGSESEDVSITFGELAARLADGSTITSSGGTLSAVGGGGGGSFDATNIATNVLPSTDNARSVGTEARTWSDGRFQTFTVEGQTTVGGIVVTGDLDVQNDIHLGDRDQLILGTDNDSTFDFDDRTNEVEIRMNSTVQAFALYDGTTKRFEVQRSGALNMGGTAVFGGLRLGTQNMGDACVAVTVSGTTLTCAQADGGSQTATLPSGGGGGEANVQADWNETNTSSDAFILNKPTVITAAERAKVAGIETGAEVNVQADWDETDSSADSFIRNKPTIPSGGGGGTFSGALVDRNADQSITTATTLAAQAWNTEEFDEGGWWASSASTRLTVPSGVDYVRVSCALRYENVGNASQVLVQLRMNGSHSIGMPQQTALTATPATSSDVAVTSAVVEVDAGDYFECMRQSNDSSITIATESWFGIVSETGGGGGGSGSDDGVADSVDLAVSGSDLTITIGRTEGADLTDTVTLPSGGGGGGSGEAALQILDGARVGGITNGQDPVRHAITAQFEEDHLYEAIFTPANAAAAYAVEQFTGRAILALPTVGTTTPPANLTNSLGLKVINVGTDTGRTSFGHDSIYIWRADANSIWISRGRSVEGTEIDIWRLATATSGGGSDDGVIDGLTGSFSGSTITFTASRTEGADVAGNVAIPSASTSQRGLALRATASQVSSGANTGNYIATSDIDELSIASTQVTGLPSTIGDITEVIGGAGLTATGCDSGDCTLAVTPNDADFPTIPIGRGGTGATSAGAARTALGLNDACVDIGVSGTTFTCTQADGGTDTVTLPSGGGGSFTFPTTALPDDIAFSDQMLIADSSNSLALHYVNMTTIGDYVRPAVFDQGTQEVTGLRFLNFEGDGVSVTPAGRRANVVIPGAATWARSASPSGTAPANRIGSGTPSEETWLRGDGAWRELNEIEEIHYVQPTHVSIISNDPNHIAIDNDAGIPALTNGIIIDFIPEFNNTGSVRIRIRGTDYTVQKSGGASALSDLEADDWPSDLPVQVEYYGAQLYWIGTVIGNVARRNTGTGNGDVPVLGSGGRLAASTLPNSSLGHHERTAQMAGQRCYSSDIAIPSSGSIAITTIHDSTALNTATIVVPASVLSGLTSYNETTAVATEQSLRMPTTANSSQIMVCNAQGDVGFGVPSTTSNDGDIDIYVHRQ